jgi:hypothetical protein
MVKRITTAVSMAEEISQKMFTEDESQEFQDALDDFVNQHIYGVDNVNELGDIDMRNLFIGIAAHFFAAGIVWGSDVSFFGQQENGTEEPINPDFTVAVETVDFISSLVRNGSLTVRFALEDGRGME